MRVTNKNTGLSFILSPKESADFFYAKNAKGEYINKPENYSFNDKTKEVSQLKFVLCCIGLMGLVISSFLLHIHLNY